MAARLLLLGQRDRERPSEIEDVRDLGDLTWKSRSTEAEALEEAAGQQE